MDAGKLFITLGLKGKEQLNKDIDGVAEKGKGLASKLGTSFGAVAKASAKIIGTCAKVGAVAIGAAATATAAIVKQSVDAFAEYEQLAGGAAKIFNDMDQTQILKDAGDAWKNMNLSANEYLSSINTVGASFAATMGDQAGYDTAKKGMQAISDYASGTGRSIEELNEKYSLITRSAATYQSIADQFSGILPATSKDFLEQAQACGLLSTEYTQLTEVPIAEYQQAVTGMLEKGTAALGLAGNTAAEAEGTISGSMAAMKASWKNLLVGLADGTQNLQGMIETFSSNVSNVARNIAPVVEQCLLGIGTLVNQLMPVIVDSIPQIVNDLVPKLMNSGLDMLKALLQGISDNKDTIISGANQLMVTFVNGLSELIPMMITVAGELAAGLLQGIIDNADSIGEGAITLLDTFIETVYSLYPLIAKAGIKIVLALANGIAKNAKQLTKSAISAILEFVRILTKPENLSALLSAAVSIIKELALGLIEALPELVESAVQLIGSFVEYLINPENMLLVAEAAIDIIIALAGALIESIPVLIESVGEICANIGQKLREMDWAQIGREFLDNLLTGLQEQFPGLFEWFSNIWVSIQGIFNGVVSWFSNIFSSAKEAIQTSWSAITDFFSGIWNDICFVFQSVEEFFREKFESAKTAIENAFSTVVSVFTQIWNDIKGVFSDAINVGKKIVEDIKSGISAAWDGLTGWFNNLWNNLFGSRRVDVNVNASSTNGSHANGLDYVPFDGYIAELHKGEMVVPAAQADYLRVGAFTTATTANTASVVNVLNKILSELQSRQDTSLTIDGREFARLVRGVV